MGEEFEDLDVNLEDIDSVQLVVSDERDPDSPFWRVSKNEILSLLRVVDGIASRNSDAVSRSMMFWEKDGNLLYSMTNRDVYLRGKLPLKNQQNILKERLILSSKQLLEVARFSSDILIFKEGDQVFASVMRGRYPLENFTFSESIYKLEEKPEFYSEPVDMTIAKTDFDLFVRLMAQASLAEDKKIVIQGGHAYGNFVSILSRKEVVYPNMVLTMLNAKDVAALLVLYASELRVGVSANRVFFRGENFEYSAVALKGEVSKEIVTKFEGDVPGVLIDGNQLFNLFSFLSLNTSDSSIAEVKCDESGMKILSRTKSGKVSEFSVVDLSLPPQQFKMQVVSSKKVFTVLKYYTSLSMAKLQDCLVFEGEGLRVILSIRG